MKRAEVGRRKVNIIIPGGIGMEGKRTGKERTVFG